MNDTWLVELHRKYLILLFIINFIFMIKVKSRPELRINLVVFELCGIIYVSEGGCIEKFIVIKCNFRLWDSIENFNCTIEFCNYDIILNRYGLLVTLFFVMICIKVPCDCCGVYFTITCDFLKIRNCATAGKRSRIFQTNPKFKHLFLVKNATFNGQLLRIRTEVFIFLR